MVKKRKSSKKSSGRGSAGAVKAKGGAAAKGKGRKEKEIEINVGEDYQMPGGFGQQVFAVLLIALAVVFVASWFVGEEVFLHQMNQGIVAGIGVANYFIPVVLVYLAVRIFTAENNRVSGVVWVATFLMLIFVAGIGGAVTYGSGVSGGGWLGEQLNNFVTQATGAVVAVFIYVVLAFIDVLVILQMSPAELWRKITGKEPKAKKAEEPEEEGGFKINRGGGSAEPAGKKWGKKAPVAAAVAAPTALVAASDPNWKAPSLNLLEKKQSPADPGNIQQNARIIEGTFEEFGIEVEMEGANIGPKVTQYTLKPPKGVNLSKIVARDKELALNLAVDKIRIEAPIPGTRSVGIEVANVRSADVRLRGVLESEEWENAKGPLTFAVGKDISGRSVVADLARMPHLLIAGTTGSGKSVMTNTLIMSLLYRNSPSEMKMIIVDPKQVEMAQYEDIPHLLAPIITETEKALSALKWSVNEMERRYSLMAKERVKNIVDYNAKMAGEKEGERMPYIVVVIDEMADLMMMAGKDLEMLIVRVAQKGRAAGMHLVLATQRPEVKVITGLIKANVPGRIAFAVGSSIDSRIMLDKSGAEKLLGKGDMLMLTTEMMGKPRRIQGAWSSDEDVAKVTDYLRAQRAPEYNDEVIAQPVQIKGMGPSDGGAIGDLGRKYDPNDPLVRKAVEISLKNKKFSTASLQTWLGKGHGFVAGLAIWFEEIGVIGPSNGNRPRDVLINSMEEFDEIVNNL